jgi:hypothetical protein
LSGSVNVMLAPIPRPSGSKLLGEFGRKRGISETSLGNFAMQ